MARSLFDEDALPTMRPLFDEDAAPRAQRSLFDADASRPSRRAYSAPDFDPAGLGIQPPSVEAFEQDPEGFRRNAADVVALTSTFGIGAPALGAGILRGATSAAIGAGRQTLAYETVKNGLLGKLPGEESTASVGIGTGAGAALGLAIGTAGRVLTKSIAPLYRGLGNLAERMDRLPRKMSELDADLPSIESQLTAKRAAERGSAARDAFREIVPANTPRESVPDIQWNRAVQSARRAAARLGRGPINIQDDPALGAQISNDLMTRLSRVPKAGPIISKVYDDSRFAWRMFVTNTAESFRKDVMRWKGIGPGAAGMLERTEFLGDHAQGERVGYAVRHIFGLRGNAEFDNMTAVVRGEAPPLNDRVAEAAQAWRALGAHGFDDATGVGLRQLVPPTHSMGQVELFPDVAEAASLSAKPTEGWVAIPLQYRPNYMPTYRDATQLTELGRANSPLRKAAIQHLIRTRGFTPQGAAETLDTVLAPSRAGGQEFDHSFQFARNDLLDELGVKFERDPRVWVRRWSHDFSIRLARAKVWGPQDEQADAMRKSLADQGGDTALWDKFWRNFIGHPHPEDVRYAGATRVVGTAMTISGLGPRVHLLQYLQLANPIAKFGVRPVLSAMLASARDQELVAAMEWTGALLPSNSMSWIGDEVGRAGSWWVKHIVRMPEADRFVRVVSAVSGGTKAQEWARDYHRLGGQGPRAQAIARQLESLSLSPRRVLSNEGVLSPAELENAMLTAANETQFPSHMTDMPMAWRTGSAGRWIYKFRTFAKQQSAFIKNHLIAEARKGNVAPAVRYLAAYTVLHQAAAPTLDWLSGVNRDEDREAYDHALDQLEGYLYAGMLGGFGDAINVARNSTAGRVGGYLFGPAVGNVLQIGEAAHQSVQQGDFSITSPLGLRLARQVPLVGGHLRNWIRENL